MKLTFAVLALLCLSTAVNASSNAADFKLPLSGLFTHGAVNAAADVNITMSDMMPHLNVADVVAALHAMPKFQMPSLNVSGLGWHNASEVLVPLVPMMGLQAVHKALPLVSIMALFNHSAGGDLNIAMPSLPSVNVSQMAVPLHALLGLKAAKAMPLLPLLAALNHTSSLNISLPHPHFPNVNISEVAVPLNFLGAHKHLLALVGNASATLPVFTVGNHSNLHTIAALPVKALLGLKAMPLALAAKHLQGAGDLAMSALSGLTLNKTISAVPLGGLASLSKSVNISDLPLGALAALGNLKAGLLSGLTANMTTGPSIDVNLRHGSIGTKNIAFNLSHPTLGLKQLALALNLSHPELAMKLAQLNVSVPLPDLRMGSRNVSVSVPLLDINPGLSNVTLEIPMAAFTMPSVNVDMNASADGNGTFGKTISITKPGLSMGSANVTLPMLKPEVALKLAQLGFNIPTAELGMKKASFGASLPMPDVRMAQKAINFTVPVPDLGRKQFGVNLTVPDIQLPRLEVNVSGMPKLSLDGLKSATLLSWLKDAGFFALNKTIDANGSMVIDLSHGN